MRKHLLSNELHKVKREILTHGEEYTFYRDMLDQYGEPTGEKEEIALVCGLFHLEKGYISNKIGDSGTVRTKGQPKILIEHKYHDLLKNGDYVYINETKYKVTERNNIQEYNIITDVSLEVVLDGGN